MFIGNWKGTEHVEEGLEAFFEDMTKPEKLNDFSAALAVTTGGAGPSSAPAAAAQTSSSGSGDSLATDMSNAVAKQVQTLKAVTEKLGDETITKVTTAWL